MQSNSKQSNNTTTYQSKYESKICYIILFKKLRKQFNLFTTCLCFLLCEKVSIQKWDNSKIARADSYLFRSQRHHCEGVNQALV